MTNTKKDNPKLKFATLLNQVSKYHSVSFTIFTHYLDAREEPIQRLQIEVS